MFHATAAAPAAYAPPVPSPLNPRSYASLHMLDPLLTVSDITRSAPKKRPGPPNRKRPARNVSPTQRLMRQKAALAWHTAQASSPHPKRMSSLLHLDHKPTTYTTNHQQQSRQRPFTSFCQLDDQQREYPDILSHPNFTLLDGSGSPGIAAAYDPPHLDIDEGDDDETDDFGLPTARLDAEKESLLSSDGGSASGRRRSAGELEAQIGRREGRVWWSSPRLSMMEALVGSRMLLLWVVLGTLLVLCGILPFVSYRHVIEEEVLGAFA